jgi:uncharacterized RDD family membrane protein YckC
MNEIKARCVAWGSHVVEELQLSPDLVARNATSPVLWRRLGAAIIDAVVLLCLFNMLNSVRLAGLNLTFVLTSYSWIDTIAPICALLWLKPSLAIIGAGVTFDNAALMLMLLTPVVEMCIIWLYHAIMESSPWQATLGKKICGIVVTGVNGERISFGRASLRTFAKCITFLPYFVIHAITDLTPMTFVPPGLEYPSLIGFAIAFASRRMQGLHDAVAYTLVKPAPQMVIASPVANISSMEATLIDPLMTPPKAKSQQNASAPLNTQATAQKVQQPQPAILPDAQVGVPASPSLQSAVPSTDDELKECPACAEWIKAKAKKCRYCQERFESP